MARIAKNKKLRRKKMKWKTLINFTQFHKDGIPVQDLINILRSTSPVRGE